MGSSTCSLHPRATDDEGVAALERHRGRWLRTETDAEGLVVISVRLSPEDGATVLAAIESTRQELGADHDADGTAAHEPYAASCADALVAVCEAQQAAGPRRERATGPRASVVVHVDRQVLHDARAEGCAHVEGVGVVSAHTVQRLVCDASVSTVAFNPDGTTVPEGRTRQIPDSLRRAVHAREGRCRWPGCDRNRYVDVHHVVFVSHGGRTRLTNLRTLFRAHHRLVHEGGYRLSMDAHAAISVTTPAGVELRTRPARSAGPDDAAPGSIASMHEREGLCVDDQTLSVGGGPYDSTW